MIDLGAHGMYIARRLLGEPRRINSTFNHMTGRAVEDNTLSVITFDNQAIAWRGLYLEINGAEGTYVTGGRSNDWVEPERLPEPLLHPVTQWINGIAQDGPIDYGLAEGSGQGPATP